MKILLENKSLKEIINQISLNLIELPEDLSELLIVSDKKQNVCIKIVENEINKIDVINMLPIFGDIKNMDINFSTYEFIVFVKDENTNMIENIPVIELLYTNKTFSDESGKHDLTEENLEWNENVNEWCLLSVEKIDFQT